MKASIKFEDNVDGTVKITTDPSGDILERMQKAKHEWTPAEQYFLLCFSHLLKNIKGDDGKIKTSEAEWSS